MQLLLPLELSKAERSQLLEGQAGPCGAGQGPGGKAQARFATLSLPLSFHEGAPGLLLSFLSGSLLSSQHPQPVSLTHPVPATHPIPGLLTISVCFWLM